MVDKDMLVLQNCMALVKVEPGSYSEACLTSSHDGNSVITIKVEDATDTLEEEEDDDSVPETFPVIKTEHEVSYISVCTFVDTIHKYTELPISFPISICLFIHIEQIRCNRCILRNSFCNV